MGAILSFPSQDPAQVAWERFQRLVREAQRNPLLFDDISHLQERNKAHRDLIEAMRNG